MSDFLAMRSSHRLAVLLRNLVTLLSWHQVALLLRHVHAVLLRHRVAVLGWHQLALLLWHVVTLLLRHIVADRLWHKFAFLPRNILALVCGHLNANDILTETMGHPPCGISHGALFYNGALSVARKHSLELGGNLGKS